MNNPNEYDSKPIKLPWSYSTYQIIAVLELIPLIALLVYDFLYFFNITFLLGVLVVPIIIYSGYEIVKICSELKSGKIRIVSRWLNLTVTSSTTPTKLHRYLVGRLFLQFLFMELIHFTSAEPLFLGVSWLSWILVGLGVIGIIVQLSGYWIPD